MPWSDITTLALTRGLLTIYKELGTLLARPYPPNQGTNHDQRDIVTRQIACNFPEGRHGITLDPDLDPLEQLIDYFVNKLQYLPPMMDKSTHLRAIEVVLQQLLHDKVLAIDSRSVSCTMRVDFRERQVGRDQSIRQNRQQTREPQRRSRSWQRPEPQYGG